MTERVFLINIIFYFYPKPDTQANIRYLLKTNFNKILKLFILIDPLSSRDLYLSPSTEAVSITVIVSNVLLEQLKKHQSEYPIR